MICFACMKSSPANEQRAASAFLTQVIAIPGEVVIGLQEGPIPSTHNKKKKKDGIFSTMFPAREGIVLQA